MKQYTYMVNLLCSCALLLFMALGLTSCKKFVTIPPPVHQVVSATVFTNDQTATATVVGLYSQTTVSLNFLFYGGLSQLAGLMADEFYNTADDPDLREFRANSVSATNYLNQSNLWARAYSHIYHANACIEGLQGATALTPAVRRQLLGEVKFLRALCYFYLVQLYGDVPLVTTTAYSETAVQPRAAVAEVYRQVVADLTEAESLLPAGYPAAGRTRANRWAATALLARVQLYRGAWAAAEEKASAVVNSGLYSLAPLSGVFLAGSSETVFQLYPILSGVNTAEGYTFNPYFATMLPAYVLTAAQQSAFEVGDGRLAAWTKTNTVGGQDYTYPNKYKINFATDKTEYEVVLRLAEQYLIRAEARAQQGKLAEAKEDLDRVRQRAGLPGTAATDKSSLLSAIEQERRCELFAEWGHRWFDLKRTGRIDAVLSAEKPGWKPFAALLPIPRLELNYNPALTQNPGYN